MSASFDSVRAAIVEEYLRSYMVARDCDAVIMLRQESGRVVYRGICLFIIFLLNISSGHIIDRFISVASAEVFSSGVILRFQTDGGESTDTRGTITNAGEQGGSSQNCPIGLGVCDYVAVSQDVVPPAAEGRDPVQDLEDIVARL